MATSANKKIEGKRALVLGGGAPNSSLIAGALVAFLEKGVHFDVISTSGAGSLMGLLYTAPRSGDPKQALTAWSNSGIADAIYRGLPVDYKVFNKPGIAADWYRSASAWWSRSRRRSAARRISSCAGAALPTPTACHS